MKDVLVDTIIDSMKILPFLFITYLIMEYIEHKMTNKNKIIIQKAGKAGPAIGGLLGMVPQCGFSASASNLYVAKIISVGTLISVYLSTSDEMLPIFFSEHVPIISIIEILALKAFIGIIFGMIIDFVYHKIKHNDENIDIHSDICSHDHCHCESENLFLSSIKHTINILFFIFIFSLIMNTLFHYIGEDTIRSIIANKPIFSHIACGILGLIPNCAASVIITQLYLKSLISFGAMMTGLLVGAGVGLLVLIKMNKNLKNTFKIISLLYCIGLFSGLLIDLLHFSVII